MNEAVQKALSFSTYSEIPLVVRVIIFYVLCGLLVACVMSIYKAIHWQIVKKKTNSYFNKVIAFALSIMCTACFYFTPINVLGSFLLAILTSPIVYLLQFALDLQCIQKCIRLVVASRLKKKGFTDEQVQAMLGESIKDEG